MESIMNIGQCEKSPQAYHTPSSRQVLEEKLKHRKKEIAEIEAAIKFLDENPSFETGMNLLQKALR